MTNAKQQESTSGSTYPEGMFIFAATLLIFLGLAFQASEAGWVHLWPTNIWLFSVIVPGLWNMLAVQWNAPIWQELLKFWPLALVATGMAMLLIQKRAYARERSGRMHKGGIQDE
ncbi:MAG: hypothetical protein WB987_01975 [Candidatus Acidiferrales bacterium]